MNQFPFGVCMRLAATVGFLVVAGCAHNDLTRLKGSPGPETAQFTTGPTTSFRASASPVVLTRIQSAPLLGFDRLVFTFSGNNVPAHQLIYKPAGTGGEAGQTVLEIRIGARPNGPGGKPGIAKKLQNQVLDYPVLKGIYQERAGEEFVIWHASLGKQSEYRVQELTRPARLVIDLKQ